MRNVVFMLMLLALVGCQSIYSAAVDQDVEGVQSYLAKGADINEPDRRGMTPLHYAAYYGRRAIVEYLLDRGANINQVNGQTGDTALLYASYYGHIPVVDILLDRGADVNVVNKYGYNALEYARKFQWTRIEPMLLARGAKPLY